MAWRLIALLFGLLVAVKAVAAPPQVAELRFEGNKTTRVSTLEREVAVEVGAPLVMADVDASVQALMDLGLFREVRAEVKPLADGQVAVLFRIREKRFVIAAPRVEGNADGDRSYGGQLRLDNVAGLNHRLRLTIENGEFPEGSRRRDERSLVLSYDAPFVFDTPYRLQAFVAHIDRGRPSANGEYDEQLRQVELGLSRDLRVGRPRAGWSVGGGLRLERQSTSGEVAPPSDGDLIALFARARFDDRRFALYSETGRALELRLDHGNQAFGSDYAASRWLLDYRESRALGNTAHQTLEFKLAAGWLGRSDDSRNEFALGGSSSLRGYPKEFLVGNRYGYAAVEWMRPVGRNWIRLLALIEVGMADDDIDGLANGRPYASLGLGVRLRAPWFVNVEVEAGVGIPLTGDDEGVRVFAGSN